MHIRFLSFDGEKTKIVFDFVETPNDGGGDGTDNRPINGEPELACIVQDQEMEEGIMIFLQTVCFSFKSLHNLEMSLYNMW